MIVFHHEWVRSELIFVCFKPLPAILYQTLSLSLSLSYKFSFYIYISFVLYFLFLSSFSHFNFLMNCLSNARVLISFISIDECGWLSVCLAVCLLGRDFNKNCEKVVFVQFIIKPKGKSRRNYGNIFFQLFSSIFFFDFNFNLRNWRFLSNITNQKKENCNLRVSSYFFFSFYSCSGFGSSCWWHFPLFE